jgi:hypothetical protein
MKKSKMVGWTISAFGIAIGIGSLLGWFVSDERMDFYNIAMAPSQSIQSTHPALRQFIKDFPPPKGYTSYQLNKTTLVTANGFAISGTLRYINTDTKEEQDVATFEDVRLWAMKTNAGWYSLIVIIIGWIVNIVVDIVDWKQTSMRERKR